MSIQLSNNEIFEFIVAILLRNNGYIAGIPRRYLGGRTTLHPVNLLGLDINNSPFNFNSIVVFKACFEEETYSDLDIVKNLKATLSDLEQTLPSKRGLIRDMISSNQGDLFHRIYGRKKGHEKFTVHYVGALFTTRPLHDSAWEYANGHGISIIYLPPFMAQKTLICWFDRLRYSLNQVISPDNSITLKGLIKKEKKHDSFREILRVLQNPGASYLLEPKQRHDLLTIVNEVMNEPFFLPLHQKLCQLMLASINGYPSILDHNLTYQQLLKTAVTGLYNKFQQGRHSSQNSKYKPLFTVKFLINEVTQTSDAHVAALEFFADESEVNASIKYMKGKIYVPVSVFDKRITHFQIKLPLKLDLNLVGDFHLII